MTGKINNSPETIAPTGENLLSTLAELSTRLIELANAYDSGDTQQRPTSVAMSLFRIVNTIQELGIVADGAETAALKILSGKEVSPRLREVIDNLVAAGAGLRDMPNTAIDSTTEVSYPAEPMPRDPSTYYDPNGQSWSYLT